MTAASGAREHQAVPRASASRASRPASRRRSSSEPSSLPRARRPSSMRSASLAVAAAAVPFAHLSLDDRRLVDVPRPLDVRGRRAALRRHRRRATRATTRRSSSSSRACSCCRPELIALLGVVYGIPEWLKIRYAWYIQAFNIANHTLNGLAAWGAVELVRNAGFGPNLEFALSGLAAVGRLRLPEPRPARHDAPFRARALVPRHRPLLGGEPLDGLRARAARRRVCRALGLEPAAPADGRRPAAPHSPLAERAGTPAGGADRREDRPLQRPPLRERPAGGARARAAVPARPCR